MDMALSACTAAPSAAHLLIDASDALGGTDRRVETLLRRVRANYLGGRTNDRTRLGLEIHDLQGRRMFTLDDAGPSVEVALPPGIYHVTSNLAGLRRRYTIALEPGAVFELSLRRRTVQMK